MCRCCARHVDVGCFVVEALTLNRANRSPSRLPIHGMQCPLLAQVAACDLLVNLASSNGEVQTEMVVGAGLVRVLDAMDNMPGDADVQEHSCAALSAMTDSLQNQSWVTRAAFDM